MKKDLYLMRHGQTLFNVRRKIQGWCDSPLTELGIQQAQSAKELLKDISFDHYYCSTAERASDTLELITDKPYIRLKGLKERYFSVFEGESEDLNADITQFDNIFPLFGGEYSYEVRDRMVKTLTEIMEKEDHHTVLAVSHAGACLNFLSAWEDANIIRKNGGFPNCSILHFVYEDKKFQFIEILKVHI